MSISNRNVMDVTYRTDCQSYGLKRARHCLFDMVLSNWIGIELKCCEPWDELVMVGRAVFKLQEKIRMTFE